MKFRRAKMYDRKCISFVSAPATGKGTAIENLKKTLDEYKILDIPVGGYIRKLKALDIIPQDHREITKEELNKHIFDALKYDVNKFYENLKEKEKSILIFDSFPLYGSQIEMYENIVREFDVENLGCIYLDAPNELLVERIQHRLVCKNCKKVYSTLSEEKMPKKGNICECGYELSQRNDDKYPEVVSGRIDRFNERVKDVKNYFTENNMLHNIDATRIEEDIIEDIIKVLEIEEEILI